MIFRYRCKVNGLLEVYMHELGTVKPGNTKYSELLVVQ